MGTRETVIDLHQDLQAKYQRHGATVERLWRSFDQPLRIKCIRAGAAGGAVLKNSSDASLGNVYKFIPEWNLKDLSKPGSDALLDILKHRATLPLTEQYKVGFSGRAPDIGPDIRYQAPGDYAFIQDMMRTKNLRHTERFDNCYTIFYDEERYG